MIADSLFQRHKLKHTKQIFGFILLWCLQKRLLVRLTRHNFTLTELEQTTVTLDETLQTRVTYSRAAIWSSVSTVPSLWWACCKTLWRDKINIRIMTGQTWLNEVLLKCSFSTFDLWTRTLSRRVVPRSPAPIPLAPSPSPTWTPPSLPDLLENCHCQGRQFTNSKFYLYLLFFLLPFQFFFLNSEAFCNLGFLKEQ